MSNKQLPHGCLLCAEVNVGFTWLNEDLGLKRCLCGKEGKVLDLQESFDYIKHLQNLLSAEYLQDQETAVLEEDIAELDFEKEQAAIDYETSLWTDFEDQ